MRYTHAKFLLSILTLFLLVGCASNTGSGEFTGSHTGAETPEEFIQNEEIVVVTQSAVQFGILALHKGNTDQAAALVKYLDSIIGTASTDRSADAASLVAEVRSGLTGAQLSRLESELATADHYISGKLDNGTLQDPATYSAQSFLTWVRDAAEWSSKGYDYDIVCLHGIALGHHGHNANKGIRFNF